MSISCLGQVNSSTPTFGNINLRETMANLMVAWKFNQKWLQNLYLHPKPYKNN